MKVITIGGATQDIFLTCQSTDQLTLQQNNFFSRYLIFSPQDKTEASTITHTTGGGATNAAVSFKRMGWETSCFFNIGNDFAGSSIIQDLKNHGVNTNLATTTNQLPSGTSLVINNPNGDRVLIAYRGANNTLTMTNSLLKSIEVIDLIYITSLSNESATKLPNISSHAKKHNVPVAINPGKSQLTSIGLPTLKKSLPYIDILIINFNEAKLLTTSLIENDTDYKKTLSSKPQQLVCATNMSDEQPYLIDNHIAYENFFFNIRSFFKEILKLGPSTIIITNGCNGVYVATKEYIYFHPSMKVPVIDTVGAGDSFGSTFAGIFKTTGNIEQALRHGIANSASVIQCIGAKEGLLSTQEQATIVHTIEPSLLQRFTL